MSLLRVHDLSVTFRQGGQETHAVKGVSFDIAEGETVALVGESGSGKSVTALSTVGLLGDAAHLQGSITFEGAEMVGADAAELRRVRGNDISFIFQEPMTSLNPVQTVGNQIIEAIRLHRRMSERQARERAVELLEVIGVRVEHAEVVLLGVAFEHREHPRHVPRIVDALELLAQGLGVGDLILERGDGCETLVDRHARTLTTPGPPIKRGRLPPPSHRASILRMPQLASRPALSLACSLTLIACGARSEQAPPERGALAIVDRHEWIHCVRRLQHDFRIKGPRAGTERQRAFRIPTQADAPAARAQVFCERGPGAYHFTFVQFECQAAPRASGFNRSFAQQIRLERVLNFRGYRER